ncbi:efflux RND transporter periplasmic adaptor subunit [Helicobacter sp. MIT 14-3879]|uniref:efflux RND transporter periplasmic adaptor subunit n=1 Tax=Helicobacter sp. MIT 14-3879 TaxID=2040649 RepID=UPI000E1F939E|nr:hypothetical protein [Helicobacter sp. MIT 14-3879]RDU65557.1 hypothetical protein CQA44_00840 [Helicobacter sp. MIT 14-3879]
MKKIILALLAVNLVFGYDEIVLNDMQSKKLGIGFDVMDFSGYSLVGPFNANLDFSNQGSLKQISPFEITIAKVNKKEGEFVKKGDVICEVMGDAISNLIYEYKNTQVKLDIALNNAKKDKALYDDGVISQREYQQSYLLANELELRLRDLNSTITQIGITTNINGFSYPVIASFDGILALSPSKSGEKIEAFVPYIVITKDKKMLANIKIPQNFISDIAKDSKVYILENGIKSEVGKIESKSVAIDKASNSIFATATLTSASLKYGGNIDVFILSKNPDNTVFIKKDNVTKFSNDYIVFVKTKEGFMPTKINIIKEVNNGYVIAKDKFNSKTQIANGSIITLKGAMSDLGFE